MSLLPRFLILKYFTAAPYNELHWLWPLLLAAAFLVCWRLWRFTILPLLRPSQAKELPYWIPFLGHVWSFLTNYHKTIEKSRVYFRHSNELYSMTVAGTSIYICTSPDDVAALYRNTTTVSFDNVMRDMYSWIGVSEAGVSKLFTLDRSAKHNINEKHALCPAIWINEYNRHQLKPGKALDNLLHRLTIPIIDKSLQDIEAGNNKSVLKNSRGIKTVSLLQLCSEVFNRGLTTAYYGRKIWIADPDLLDSMEKFERTSWKYMFQLPEFLSKDMIQARDSLILAFSKYLAIPSSKRDDSNDFAKSSENLMKDVGLSHDDISKVFMLNTWALVGSTYKIAFWTLSYLVYDSSLLKCISDEVAPAVTDGKVDEAYLVSSCPLLDSLISEVFRLVVATALVRDVVAPTELGNKVIPPGAKILVPYRQLHLNTSVWGPTPLSMNPRRFALDPKLSSSKSYRPFGGGHSLCPGRFFSRRIISYTIAALVTKYDLELDAKMTQRANGKESRRGIISTKFPEMNMTKPTPGSVLPLNGQDVFVVMKTK